jgi:anti-sigma B factor antagonist
MPDDAWPEVPEALSVEIDRDEPGSAVVILHGDVDVATCDQLRDALDALDDVAKITVDLRGLDFMDSSGVHCLLDAHSASKQRGVEFRLVDGPAVTHVLDVSGVRPFLVFVDG